MSRPKITPDEIDKIQKQFAATLYQEGIHEIREANGDHFVLGINNDTRWDFLLFALNSHKVITAVKFGPHASNVHKGVQGGALASILDATCFLACTHLTKQRAPTAYLNVKYLKPAKIDHLYVVEITTTHEGRKVYFQSTLMDLNKTPYCTGEALFLLPPAKL